MSVTYEDAMETLQSMFGPPWTRETIDAVLRHYNGHMENTVDSMLRHGDKSPQLLIDQLKSGTAPSPLSANATSSNATDLDEQLARQLSREQGVRPSANVAPGLVPSLTTPTSRGTPTQLPDDFLRIPQMAAGATSSSADMLASDEALARMLQDELFSQELARNPDFAHLARPRTVGGMPVSTPGFRRDVSEARIGELPNRGSNQAQRNGATTPASPNIMKTISELGDNARRRLQLLAAQFNANRDNKAGKTGGSGAGSSVAAAERRGLLDDDDNDNMELAARKDL